VARIFSAVISPHKGYEAQKLRSLFVVLPMLFFALAGCDSKAPVSFTYSCPEQQLVQLDLIDLSSSGRTKDILDERLKAIQLDVERVTDCEGTFTVVAWSVSSSASFTVFQGSLSTSGSTEIGRDRKIPKAVAQTMVEIRGGLTEALTKVDPVGSDLFGAFSLAEDQNKILGEDEHLEINIFTDAITNVPPGSVNQSGLSEDQVIQLAERTSQINLKDVQVKLIGIGKTGVEVPQPPQDYILLLRSYAEAMCNNTQAKCITLTAVIE
jgi:hypothetical protein